MWNVEPIQIQQYYETLVTLGEVTHRRDRETKQLRMIDILCIQKMTMEILN
jgi:hypothetical protein